MLGARSFLVFSVVCLVSAVELNVLGALGVCSSAAAESKSVLREMLPLDREPLYRRLVVEKSSRGSLILQMYVCCVARVSPCSRLKDAAGLVHVVSGGLIKTVRRGSTNVASAQGSRTFSS